MISTLPSLDISPIFRLLSILFIIILELLKPHQVSQFPYKSSPSSCGFQDLSPACVYTPSGNCWLGDTKLLGEPLVCQVLSGKDLLYVVLIANTIRHFAAKIAIFIHFTVQKEKGFSTMGRNRRCGFLAAQTNDLGHPSRASCMERFHISRFRWTACGKNAASPWEIPIHIDAKANYMKNIYSHLPRMPEKPTAVKQCDKTCRFRLRNAPFGPPKQAVLHRQTALARNPLAASHLHKETPWQANAPHFFTKWHGRSSAAPARAGTKKRDSRKGTPVISIQRMSD